MFLDSFLLPINQEENMIKGQSSANGGYIDNIYPCNLFSKHRFKEIFFKNVTIFYGGNGSGKSTLLNLVANKLSLNRIAPFNSSELFDTYTKACKYSMAYDDEGFIHRIPDGSRIITSDDIFDYMLTVRVNNEEISAQKQEGRDVWADLKFGETIKFRGMDDYEDFRLQVLARRKSVTRRQFIKRTVGDEVKLDSNGETALHYFETKLKPDTLYCLDEPENSMSPKMQLELVKYLQEMSHYCGCQFIIATHSPFLLALEGARIYDLDSDPVEVRNWWELENVKIYFDFFERNRNLFAQDQ